MKNPRACRNKLLNDTRTHTHSAVMPEENVGAPAVCHREATCIYRPPFLTTHGIEAEAAAATVGIFKPPPSRALSCASEAPF
mmetsp:Transcript_137778/g.439717  ORF Transcript_137778/g.439717 Transcript_137778/m.439717 type:complete len:82 (+) Transcript_137778:236-481(+)